MVKEFRAKVEIPSYMIWKFPLTFLWYFSFYIFHLGRKMKGCTSDKISFLLKIIRRFA